MRGPRSFIASSPAIAVIVAALIAWLGAGAYAATGVTAHQVITRAASSRLLPATALTFHNLRLINGWKAFTDPRDRATGGSASCKTA